MIIVPLIRCLKCMLWHQFYSIDMTALSLFSFSFIWRRECAEHCQMLKPIANRVDKNYSAKFDITKVRYRRIPKARSKIKKEAHAPKQNENKNKSARKSSKISTIAFKKRKFQKMRERKEKKRNETPNDGNGMKWSCPPFKSFVVDLLMRFDRIVIIYK